MGFIRRLVPSPLLRSTISAIIKLLIHRIAGRPLQNDATQGGRILRNEA